MIPRYYQQESHDAAWDYLRTDAGSPVIVLPTGAGKSLVIAMLVEQAREYDARVIVLQHRKELIQQNAEKIRALLPGVPIGINSAGLKQRDYDTDVICAGIQSVYKHAERFGRRELIVIDEVHLVGDNDKSMYGQFISRITELNNTARLIGLTATPFRTGEGRVAGADKLFQSICYESQTGDLIKEGYLCPVTNKIADNEVDTSEIRVAAGEFVASDAERAFDQTGLVLAACEETVTKCYGRNSVLVFAAGVEHAEHVAGVLEKLTGEKTGLITGETFPMVRQNLLEDFKSGKLRWLVNCNVLTTGFDAPNIDAISVLRATMSPGLFAQIVGRGFRLDDGKEDCLILDFGGNLRRHGNLDSPDYGMEDTGSGTGEAPEMGDRTCPNCESEVSVRFQTCPECQFRFPREDIEPNHDSEADDQSSITGHTAPEVWDVVGCAWAQHNKRGQPEASPTLRLDYKCQPVDDDLGNLTEVSISEWVCIEHDGYAGTKASQWWQTRSSAPRPDTVEEATEMMDRHMCRVPSKITTTRDGKWFRIVSVEFEDDRPGRREWALPLAKTEMTFDDDDVPF